MSFVLDASVAGAWFLPDETSQFTERVLDRLNAAGGYAPAMFWAEMRSLLLTAERRRRLAAGDAEQSMQQLRRLPISVGDDLSDGAILDLALRHRLSAYDASYLDLARHRGLPLATFDKALVTAAHAEGVPILA